MPTPALQAYSPSPLPAADPAQVAKARKVAQDFESSFLQVMMGQMFEGVGVGSGFDGGEGEQAFKSFLTDAFAAAMARRGGVGLAKPLTHELLKRQGLSEGAPA
jgi:Rod binding domain-containing protein